MRSLVDEPASLMVTCIKIAIIVAASMIFDTDPLIESLVCRNKLPKVTAVGSGEVHFDKAFDWDEYNRSFGLLLQMPKRIDDLWAKLPENFNDRRYVTTVATSSGAKRNILVGDACFELARSTLTVPYMNTAPKSRNRKILAVEFMPEFLDDAKSARKWIRDRKDKSVCDLQIEMCSWAKETIAGGNSVLTATEQEEWIAAIDRTETQLRSDRKIISPNVFASFESLSPKS